MDQKMVKSPAHYTEGRKYEPKDVIRDWGLDFNLGSTVKYIARAGRKDDILQELYKAKEFLQFEIDAIEAERAQEPKPATPKHPNCRCVAPMDREDGLDAIRYALDMLMQDEILSVKPIVIEVPEGEDIKAFMEKIKKGLRDKAPEIKPADPEPTATEFQKRAMSLYNAYLYKLDKISKELTDIKNTGGKDTGCVFSPTMVLKEGFNPDEVLEGLTKKIMEGR